MIKELEETARTQYLNTLKNAKKLCDLRTLGIERKGYIKHALDWAIERATPMKPRNVSERKEEWQTHVCPKCNQELPLYFVMRSEIKQPPLGLMPMQIFWKQYEGVVIEDFICLARLEDAKNAISRYLEANCKIPEKWIEEYNILLERLKIYETTNDNR